MVVPTCARRRMGGIDFFSDEAQSIPQVSRSGVARDQPHSLDWAQGAGAGI